MTTQKTRLYFIFGLLFATFSLALLIIWPFVDTLVLAMVFATIFQPVYTRFLKLTKHRKGLAALGTIFLALLFIIGPLAFLGTQIFQEAHALTSYLSNDDSRSGLINRINPILAQIQALVPGLKIPEINISQFLRQIADWIIGHIAPFFGSLASVAMSTLIFLVAFFSLLVEGPKLVALVKELSPLNDNENDAIVERLKMAINVAIKGSLAVATAQGIVATIGYLIFGLPSAILWGCMTAVSALIPSFGTSLVIGPAILYLLLSGHIFQGIGLLLWGIFAAGSIDNFLYPKLVGSGMKLHPIFILLAVLGGISLFGPIGFVLGPLCISLFFAIFDIYVAVNRKETLRA